jgi:hypothetical protein
MSCAADRLPASAEHIDKVCATQMASYKIQLKSIQGGIALDYASIGATKPEIIDGVGIKNFTDVRDALWEASPYVAITKTKNIAADKSVHWSWNDQFHAGGTSDFSLFHAQFLREHDTQIYATLWKKTDFQWAVWVITKEGKCGSFNSENGNYKGLTVL